MALRRWARTFAGGAPSRAMARLNARHPWNHNDHFHGWVLANLPARRRSALDVGCGHGGLVAALAPYFETVRGHDSDAAVRRHAEARCAGLANVSIHGEAWTRAPGPIDLVTMVAVLHHLDVPRALADARDLLAPGGRFLAVGLAPPSGFVDHAWDLASIVTNPVIGYVKHPWPHVPGPADVAPPVPLKDPTIPFAELRQIVGEVMPGAVMRHHLGFRHTIAWTRPGGGDPPRR